VVDHISGVHNDQNIDEEYDTDEDFEQDEDGDDPDEDFNESDDEWFDAIDNDEIDDNFANEVEEPDVTAQQDDDSVESEEDEPEETNVRRSTRDVNRPKRYSAAQVDKGNGKSVKFQDQEAHDLEQVHNLIFQSTDDVNVKQYDVNEANVMARMMTEIYLHTTSERSSYFQQYTLKNGLKKFGVKGSEAASKELDQLHQRNCFTRINVTPTEKKKAMNGLMFLTEN